MSSISCEKLYSIYGNFLPSFVKLSQLAREYKVNFEVCVNPSGDISFVSREYGEEDGQKVVYVNEVIQGKDYVTENSRKHVLRG